MKFLLKWTGHYHYHYEENGNIIDLLDNNIIVALEKVVVDNVSVIRLLTFSSVSEI